MPTAPGGGKVHESTHPGSGGEYTASLPGPNSTQTQMLPSPPVRGMSARLIVAASWTMTSKLPVRRCTVARELPAARIWTSPKSVSSTVSSAAPAATSACCTPAGTR